MSDSKETKKYTVRLKRGFPMPVHRRAGYTFANGEALEVELDKAGKEAVKTDPWLEFVDESKSTSKPNEGDPKPKTASGRGRNYSKDQGKPNEGDPKPKTAEELAALPREDLNAEATKAGIAEPEKIEEDATVVEAILKTRESKD